MLEIKKLESGRYDVLDGGEPILWNGDRLSVLNLLETVLEKARRLRNEADELIYQAHEKLGEAGKLSDFVTLALKEVS